MFSLFEQMFLLEIFIVSDLIKKLGGEAGGQGAGNQDHKLVSMVHGNGIDLTQALITVETNALTQGFISCSSTVNYSLILCEMETWRECPLGVGIYTALKVQSTGTNTANKKNLAFIIGSSRFSHVQNISWRGDHRMYKVILKIFLEVAKFFLGISQTPEFLQNGKSMQSFGKLISSSS